MSNSKATSEGLIPLTTEEEAEWAALKAQIAADRNRALYSELRAQEYPPIADYLDGIVKGDQAQVQAYIGACLAVKLKFPKPTE
jgi:hypothetical protein